VDDATTWVHRGGVLLVGFAAAGVGGFLGFFAALAFAFSCHGDTASAGASESVLCEGSADDVIFWAGWGASIGAPLLGMIWSLNAERWRPLWIGIGGSVLVLLVLVLLIGSL
jgi:hypothetical protein